jgi:cobyric acid synthase
LVFFLNNRSINLFLKPSFSNQKYEFNNRINENLEKLAHVVESNVDIGEILAIMGI